MIANDTYRALSVKYYRPREQKDEPQQDYQIVAAGKNRLAAALRVSVQGDPSANLVSQTRFERQAVWRQQIGSREARPFLEHRSKNPMNKNSIIVLIAAASALLLAAPVMAQEIMEGTVEDITITIKTDAGTKTYQVDSALELDDVDEGDEVRFVVDDDEIELIEEINDDDD